MILYTFRIKPNCGNIFASSNEFKTHTSTLSLSGGERKAAFLVSICQRSLQMGQRSLADSPNGTDVRMGGRGQITLLCPSSLFCVFWVLPVTILFVFSQFIHLASLKTADLKSEQLFCNWPSLSRPLAANAHQQPWILANSILCSIVLTETFSEVLHDKLSLIMLINE